MINEEKSDVLNFLIGGNQNNWYDELLNFKYLINYITIFDIAKIEEIYKFEAPDFIVKLKNKEIVGVEITKIKDSMFYEFSDQNNKKIINENILPFLEYNEDICNSYEADTEEIIKKNNEVISNIKKHFQKKGDYENNIKKFMKINKVDKIIYILDWSNDWNIFNKNNFSQLKNISNIDYENIFITVLSSNEELIEMNKEEDVTSGKFNHTKIISLKKLIK